MQFFIKTYVSTYTQYIVNLFGDMKTNTHTTEALRYSSAKDMKYNRQREVKIKKVTIKRKKETKNKRIKTIKKKTTKKSPKRENSSE